MQNVIQWLAGMLAVDEFTASLLLCWALVICWGMFVLVVSYRSRRWERDQMSNPPIHPYFPPGRHASS